MGALPAEKQSTQTHHSGSLPLKIRQARPDALGAGGSRRSIGLLDRCALANEPLDDAAVGRPACRPGLARFDGRCVPELSQKQRVANKRPQDM